MRTKKVRKSHQTFRSVGMCADGHVFDMRALRDVRNSSVIPSVIYIDKAVGYFVGDCGTIP
jgi:uncharacterized membrane protein